jgi:hypothetical protein
MWRIIRRNKKRMRRRSKLREKSEEFVMHFNVGNVIGDLLANSHMMRRFLVCNNKPSTQPKDMLKLLVSKFFGGLLMREANLFFLFLHTPALQHLHISSLFYGAEKCEHWLGAEGGQFKVDQ